MMRTTSVTTPLRVVLAAAGFVAVTLLAGCETGAPVVTGPSTAPSTATTPSPVPSAAPSTEPSDPTTPSTAADTSTAAFDNAKTQWTKGATAISAQQGIYWAKAAAYLTAGIATDTDSTGYIAAAHELTDLVALPDAQQTPAQNAEYHAAIDALNTFFNTPGLYS